MFSDAKWVHVSASPARRSPKSRRSPSPRRTPPRGENPEGRNVDDGSPAPKDVSPRGRAVDSRSPSPHRSDADVSSRGTYMPFGPFSFLLACKAMMR